MNISAEASSFKVDPSRGQCVSRVSSEWFSRPADQRFLSLDDLQTSLQHRANHSRSRIVDSRDIRIEACPDEADALSVILPGGKTSLQPTHWAFGQLCTLVGAPAGYLREMPEMLAGINLQYGLSKRQNEQIKILELNDGQPELRAATGPDYGRVFDCELVEAVRQIAGNGVGDTRWKVPGVLDWATSIYHPHVDVTKETTTLYASDRDVFLFLVDDTHPIEAGRLPDGAPDLFFRGFYCWNSEVGSKTLGIASFYLRAVCQNRNLWGVEGFEEIVIRHRKYAASRFANEVAPALETFANSSPSGFIAGIKSARQTIVARNDDDRRDFLKNLGFSKTDGSGVIQAVLEEEGRAPESIFDFVQGITALARRRDNQDARVDLEQRAKRLLDRVR
jgi:hypothetical protein